MKWHKTLDRRLVALDVDTIEWRLRNGEMVPVAIIEITRVDGDNPVPQSYLTAIIKRFTERDMQGKATRYLAAALKIPAYIVLFRYDCSEFWLYPLTTNEPTSGISLRWQNGWQKLWPGEMALFLNTL